MLLRSAAPQFPPNWEVTQPFPATPTDTAAGALHRSGIQQLYAGFQQSMVRDKWHGMFERADARIQARRAFVIYRSIDSASMHNLSQI